MSRLETAKKAVQFAEELMLMFDQSLWCEDPACRGRDRHCECDGCEEWREYRDRLRALREEVSR